jgi:glycerol-3-phosphate dehydrogenase
MNEPTITADVAIIGAGVSGASVARTLARYELDVVLLEREADVAFQTSKANSGIIHAGFHHNKKYLKTELELRGNMMFDRLHRELGFPFQRCGILVVAMEREELKYIWHLYEQGQENGVFGMEMCSRERMLDLEPGLNTDVVGGLYAPTGGIIEPYLYGFTLVESAKKNGVRVFTEFEVVGARYSRSREGRASEGYSLQAADDRTVEARYVINAAGLYADEVSRIFGGEELTISPRKGEYYVMDKATEARPRHVLFPVPTPVSKGILIIPTVEGTVLVGPTAEEVRDKGDLSTSTDKLELAFNASRKMMRTVSQGDAITTFAGSRPSIKGGDFYIAVSEKAPRFIQVAGIQSPGLTASPAIGEYVKDLLKRAGCRLVEKTDFDPYVDREPRLNGMNWVEADDLIAQNPAYGNIVCRCENVSEAEIVAAIRKGHRTLDGIKFYSRAGMGRCQGGFCTYKILKILMRETGMSYDRITKHGAGSILLVAELGDSGGDTSSGGTVSARGRGRGGS